MDAGDQLKDCCSNLGKRCWLGPRWKWWRGRKVEGLRRHLKGLDNSRPLCRRAELWDVGFSDTLPTAVRKK